METKIFKFIGADHKVGTTMLTRSIADSLKENAKNKTVLVMHLNADPSNLYVKEIQQGGIDGILDKLQTHVIEKGDIQRQLIEDGNIYTLYGPQSSDFAAMYQPEYVDEILALLDGSFDIILIDAGADIYFNGLSVGAYNCKGMNILVTTQQEASYETYLRRYTQCYSRLENVLDLMIINKFTYGSGHVITSERETIGRYGFDDCYLVRSHPAGLQAEADHKTLYSFGKASKAYIKDIDDIATEIIMGEGNR